MAKRNFPPIKTISYCHVGDKIVCTDDLTPEQKEELGFQIKKIWCENLYRGQAKFYRPGEEPLEVCNA